MNFQPNAFALSVIFLFGPHSATSSAAHLADRLGRPIETTITALVESPQKFNGRRVHVFASFHSDGVHFSVLMEPNCGLFNGTSKTPPPNQRQCSRGIAADSAKTIDDAGDRALDEALAKGGRGTADKHITAEFTGRFRCVPSCASPKHFNLEIERTENVKVELKDMKPHRPTS